MGLKDELEIVAIMTSVIGIAVLFRCGRIYEGALIFWISTIIVSMGVERELKKERGNHHKE